MLDETFKLITEDEKFIYFNGEKISKDKLDKKVIQKNIDKLSTKTDYKALSHSLRIALEVRELLLTNFIKFPLKDAQRIKQIKEGNCDTENVIDQIQDVLDEVDKLLLDSDLPDESNREKMNEIILGLLV